MDCRLLVLLNCLAKCSGCFIFSGMKDVVVLFKMVLVACIAFHTVVPTAVLAQSYQHLSDQVDAEIAYANSVLQTNENIPRKIQQNIFVKAIVDKTVCVVGEPVLVTYQLCTRLNSQSKVATQPTFSGCTVYEITSADTLPSIAKINDLYFKIYEIRKVVIVPLQAGNLQLGAAVVDNTIEFYSTNANKQNASPDIHRQVSLTSNAPILQVLSLPANTLSHSFKGGIGNFTIRAAVTKGNDTVNGSNSLQITISGQGNLAAIEPPLVPWPAGISYFEHTVSSQINAATFPIKGSVVFTIPFSAKQVGFVAIPPISFTFFNPAIQQYITVQTDSIAMQIAEEKNGIQQWQIAQANTISPKQYVWIVPVIAIVALALLFIKRKQRDPATPVSDIPSSVAPLLANNRLVDGATLSNIPTNMSPALLQSQIANLLQSDKVVDSNWCKAAIAIAEQCQLLAPSVTAQAIIDLGNEVVYAPHMVDCQADLSFLLKKLADSLEG